MKMLDDNLDKEGFDLDLFGNKIDKLSMKDRIGFLPLSIWQPDWIKVKKLKGIIGDTGQARELINDSVVTRLPGFDSGASIFNPHLAQMILAAYCPKAANIYDPFAGGGTRALIAASMGHKYYGVELRSAEVERIREVGKSLDKKFHVRQGDSQIYEFDNGFFDFSFTCPPYYDLEVYSNDKLDLSNAPSYEDFLNGIESTLEGVLSGLKKDGLSIWVVGNFRDKKGNLRHFSGDLIQKAKDVGFVLHDEIIWWGASGSAAQRVKLFAANRKSVRVHEYIVILRKP